MKKIDFFTFLKASDGVVLESDGVILNHPVTKRINFFLLLNLLILNHPVTKRSVFLNCFFLLNLLIINQKAIAQKGFSIEPTVHFGRIVKHTPKLLFPTPPLSIGTEIHFNWQTYGKKTWHEWQGYPNVGFSILNYNLGNAQIFGQAFAAYPSLDLRVFKKMKTVNSFLQLGWGLAYLTRHYDQFTNPQNNAVGSAVNNITNFKLRFQKQLSTHWKAQIGLSFTHFSNGASRLPNFGINIPAVNVGASWTPEPVNTEGGYIHHYALPKTYKKLGINAFGGLGLSASTEPRGPKYPIYSTIFSIVRPLTKVNNLSLGVQFEQNHVVSEFGLASGEFATKVEANKAGSRWGAYIGEEFLYGRVGLIVQSGFYFRHYIRVENIWFNRLGVRVYSPTLGRTNVQGHIGIYMKAHKINAEQFCLMAGVSF